MKALLPLALALVAGCTLFTAPLCDPAACPGANGCHADGWCVTECSADDECKADSYCRYRHCERRCDTARCDGFACDDITNECLTSCFDDEECAPGYWCCTSLDAYDGYCDDADARECLKR